ncbi:MAG TPA: ATP-binding protein, partial [Vicinamibacteria bacterium]|nr:ATP-binding protein [Vicinamibacteria bacterium]
HRSLLSKLELRAELSAEPLPLRGDWSRLAQVVGNLLQNAVKFTPSGGRVTVASSAEAGRAVVRVADTGVGMAPEMLAQLFEPFAQADASLHRSQGGLGLGLALVRGLVELHGGAVSASSPGPGAGSEFVVSLPLETTPVAEPAAEGVAHPPGRLRVLVIEDNRDAADSLRELLQLEGHEVAVAHDGREGLDRVRELRPELVLCDVGLPQMDGYAVARAIRQDPQLREVRLVALSGYALPDDLRRAEEAGFERHLAKPASREQLRALFTSYRPGSPTTA